MRKRRHAKKLHPLWPFKSLGAPRGVMVLEPVRTSLVFDRGRAVPYADLYKTSPAVRACVDFLSVNTAQTPIHGHARSSRTGRDRLPPSDPLERLLRRPNPQTSGFEWRRDLVTDLCLHANSFSLKVRDDGGQVGALVRVPPDRVSVERREGEPVRYRVRHGIDDRAYAREDVLHVKLYAPDGLLGVSPLESLRAILAEDDTATRHRYQFWKNAARREGFIERPLDAPDWSDEAREAFRADWRAVMTGEHNAGQTGVLEEGMHWVDAVFSAKDSEFIAAREQVLRFVASVFAVPLQLLGASERNVDAAQRALILNTLAGWFTLIEDALDRDLVPDVHGARAVDGAIFTEFVVEARSRGSFLQHAEIIERAVGGPYLTVNEARARFNLPPVDGGDAVSRDAKMIPQYRHRLHPAGDGVIAD